MARGSPPAAVRDARWHVYPWPPLAWVESAVKAVAMGVGTLALAQALANGHFEVPTSGKRAIEVGVLLVLSLGMVAAIADRIKEREQVSMVFVLFNNLGHWGMLVALLSQSGAADLLVTYAALMLLGDLVKILFVGQHNFSVRQYGPRTVQALTAVFALGYAILLGLALF